MRFLMDVADRSFKEEFEQQREERRQVKAVNEASPSRGTSKGRSNERRPVIVEEKDFNWPAKLKDLFELDDDNTEYVNPFSNPKELMDNF